MLKKRLIPVLLLQNGLLVRSERFDTHQIIGDPVHEVARYNEWQVDELIYLDISRTSEYDLQRDDQAIKGLSTADSILDAVSRRCFVPLTWGGRIRSIDDMTARFATGADKIAVNSAAARDPTLVERAAQRFGSQAVVVSIDVAGSKSHGWSVFIDGGRTRIEKSPWDWAAQAEARGAGEILLQSISRDGTGEGYDLYLISAVAKAISIPVIACGGVGTYEHFAAGINAGADAMAAANIFHFKELADRNGKRALKRAGIEVR